MTKKMVKYFIKKIFRSQQDGFALLYALLLTGAVLSVGVILMNIITKQLIFSSINRSSEVSYYYAANSGRECLADAITKELFIEYDEYYNSILKNSLTLNCFNKEISLTKDSDDKFTSSDVTFEGRKVDLVVYVNAPCLDNEDGCDLESPDITKKYKYVAIATGYSDNTGGPRSTKRSAPFVLK